MGLAVVILFIVLSIFFDELKYVSDKKMLKLRIEWINSYLSTKVLSIGRVQWNESWMFKIALVFLTDGEHFYRMLKKMCAQSVAFIIFGWWVTVVAYIDHRNRTESLTKFY